MGTNINNLLPMIERLVVISGIDFLILHQNSNQVEINEYHQSIRVLPLDNLGLSKSRNAALTYAQGEFIWLLDDDVMIEKSRLLILLKHLQNNPSVDFLRVWINCLENSDEFFKNYQHLARIHKLNLLQFSSIEIICRRDFVRQHNIQFNERIGLGTPYQATEEANFLIDAWQCNARFASYEEPFVQHTCNFEGRVLATDNIMLARGATASRYGVLGVMLSLRWGIRYLIKYKKISYFISIVKGLYLGYDGFNKAIDSNSI
ncbi:glycosyltransferase family A protein [Thalassotalea fonticola]|uniref:Glycosyltransferase family A protein n=1 Tax=Thalassotalea fonticola TaxID=3065649 RepID=A0ABZ0GQ45_9GAMM|nr:glycosyltransferase family A protein [Colwelliaceae bacterium S1-1]